MEDDDVEDDDVKGGERMMMSRTVRRRMLMLGIMVWNNIGRTRCWLSCSIDSVKRP